MEVKVQLELRFLATRKVCRLVCPWLWLARMPGRRNEWRRARLPARNLDCEGLKNGHCPRRPESSTFWTPT